MNVRQWNLFCRVVDNYGDIGFAWRLARQLAHEHGIALRLWVDDLVAFKQICAAVDSGIAEQSVDSVRIFQWRDDIDAMLQTPTPCDAVIELFACGLPGPLLHSMAAGDTQPVWVDLDYLSAEPWVDGVHGAASPHPRLAVTRHFFCPGFTTMSGGLIRERGLDQARIAFQSDVLAQQDFWDRLGVAAARVTERRASMFAYANAPLSGLFGAMAEDTCETWTVVVPEGMLRSAIEDYFDVSAAPGAVLQRGALRVVTIPFLDQDDYDKLLWACDVNFVRGEDSFVRAQWAARPFVWHIYPQDEGVHRIKLDAFLVRYEIGQSEHAGNTQRAFWHAWNTPGGHIDAAWQAWWADEPEHLCHAVNWRAEIEQLGDLASHLVEFVAKRRGDLLN